MSNFHDFGLLFVSGRVEKATSILHGTLGVPLPPNQRKRKQLVNEDVCWEYIWYRRTAQPFTQDPRFAGYCAELQLLITANRYVCGLFVVTQVTSYILAIWCLNSRVVSLLPVVCSFTHEQSFLSSRKTLSPRHAWSLCRHLAHAPSSSSHVLLFYRNPKTCLLFSSSRMIAKTPRYSRHDVCYYCHVNL